MLEMLSKERARNGRGSMTWILKHCVVPEKRRSPEVNLFRSVKYPYRFRERDSVIDGEPAALLYPCTQVLFEDSDSLLTMLLLSQAAYSLCPLPPKDEDGLDDAGALVRDLSRVATEKCLSLLPVPIH